MVSMSMAIATHAMVSTPPNVGLHLKVNCNGKIICAHMEAY